MRVPLEVTNLKIYKGADFEQDFQLIGENGLPINLTNCNVLAKIKKYPGSKTFNTFDISFIDRPNGIIRLLIGNSTTIFLSSGRNYFDVCVVYASGKISPPVIIGTALVEDTAISLIVPGQRIGDLGTVDTTNLQDGDVLMYNQDDQKLEFTNL